MNYKKSKISFFTCITLCSVSFLAQTNALRAAEVEEEKVATTSVVEELVVDPAKLALAEAPEVEDVVSIKKFFKTVESGTNPENLETNLNSVIRSIVGSPIPEDQYFDSLGLDIIRLVQRTESIRVLDLIKDPHARDYYTLLPENLPDTHPNLKYYQWLSQAVYTTHVCLQNKEVDAIHLQASYSAYFCGGIKGYEWLRTATRYFENILKYLAKSEEPENSYLCISSLYDQKKRELLAELAGRFSIDVGVHPTKGKLEFTVFNAKRGNDSLLSAFGLSYEDSVQILLDAISDGRIFIKDIAGYYDNINRRLYATAGGEAFVKKQIIAFYNHYTALPNEDSLSWCAELLKGMLIVGDAASANEKLKSTYQQECEDHKARAPYLADVGAEPGDEAEHLSWNARFEDWKKEHESDFDKWNDEKGNLDRIYKIEHFNLVYTSVLARVNQSSEALNHFIKEDFARLFKDEFVEVDPSDAFQSMAYVTLLLSLKSCNLSYWNLVVDENDSECGVKIANAWEYSLSRLAHSINVLRTVDEGGHVNYLKLVPVSDYVGLAEAVRRERALALQKITTLSAHAPSAEAAADEV